MGGSDLPNARPGEGVPPPDGAAPGPAGGGQPHRGTGPVPKGGTPRSDTSPSDTSPSDDAAQTWRVLVGVFLSRRDRFLELARDLGITPVHSQALRLLRDEACPMRALAQQLQCDASNVTAIVDRLEGRGYVKRQPSPTDRRVKLLVLTDAGLEAANRVEAALFEPPPAMGNLTAAERATLRKLAARLAERPEG